MFASGGSTNLSDKILNGLKKAPVVGNSFSKDDKKSDLTTAINMLNDILSDISENGIEAYLDYDTFKRTTKKIDNAQAASKAA